MQQDSLTIQKVLEKLKITSLNDMQVASLEANTTGKDIVLLSPTGSGKTLGFLLPILQTLDPAKPGVQALILAPSRELAVQIDQVFRMMGTDFKVNCCYGGHSTKVERNNLVQPPAVLIGTPGRIADHIRRGSFETTAIHTLVLDEFDKALEYGFQGEMTFIIDQLHRLKKRILTSATPAVEIPSFTGVTSPIKLNFLDESISLPQRLTLKAVISEGNDKLEALFRLICQIGHEATLIFCNHREAVERISELLHQQGVVHDIFHGGLEQEDRDRALIKFRNGSNRLLITTDLASRGLDIPEIKSVVHYQLPTNENAFVHRNGRTARMTAEGSAFLVLSENEALPPFIQEAPTTQILAEIAVLPENPIWVTLYIAAGKKDKINKTDIVGLLLQKGNLQKEELGLLEVRDFYSFAAVNRSKASRVVELVKNEKLKNRKVKIEIAN
ncbi:MAG: DEAD/DEAH box helicase [Bacteroidota bacterium]